MGQFSAVSTKNYETTYRSPYLATVQSVLPVCAHYQHDPFAGLTILASVLQTGLFLLSLCTRKNTARMSAYLYFLRRKASRKSEFARRLRRRRHDRSWSDRSDRWLQDLSACVFVQLLVATAHRHASMSTQNEFRYTSDASVHRTAARTVWNEFLAKIAEPIISW